MTETPMFPGDQGSLEHQLLVMSNGQVVLDFGRKVAQLGATRDQALEIVKATRELITATFGPITPPANVPLPLIVQCDKARGIVRVFFPTAVQTVTAHPETMMAFANELERAACQL